MGHERSLLHSSSLRGEEKQEAVKAEQHLVDTFHSKAWAMKEV